MKPSTNKKCNEDSLIVKKSHIHGKGLFTTEKIKKGAVIGICKTRPTKRHGLYTLSLDDGINVDVICNLKFINHSKKPNVAYYNDLSVVSLRAIKPGEELTHDYGDDWI